MVPPSAEPLETSLSNTIFMAATGAIREPHRGHTSRPGHGNEAAVQTRDSGSEQWIAMYRSGRTYLFKHVGSLKQLDIQQVTTGL